MSTERKFHAAVNIIQNLPKSGPISTPLETMLKFYAYYKQATEGPNTSPKPSFWDIVRKTKWDAWAKLGDMSKDDAMERYIEEFIKIVDRTTNESTNVEEGIKSLATLVEAVNNEDIDILLGPTIDKLFAKTGSKKLLEMKNKVLKTSEEASGTILNVDDERRHESKQSEYYIEAPQHNEGIGDKVDLTTYQLSNGHVKTEANGVVTRANGAPTWTKNHSPPKTDPKSRDHDEQKQLRFANEKNTCSEPNNETSRTTKPSSILVKYYDAREYPSEVSSDMSENIVNIEQQLNKVAEKLNVISQLYKKSQSTQHHSLSIPTMGLIILWPILTQVAFTWYANRTRHLHPSR